MPRSPRILIVGPTTPLANLLVTWLAPVPYEIVAVSQFAAARVHVDMEPDLLITEVKLHDHNGLHLALRARAKSVPAVVIGDPDPVLERDAREFGATYLHVTDLHRDEFLQMVDRLIASGATTGPRHHLAWLDSPPTSGDRHHGALDVETVGFDESAGRPLLH
jgi:DNA-binding response OmpR family regulator